MATNARKLITAALTDIGAYSQGESVSAADLQEGFRRLNAMVASWITQNLIATATVRNVFALEANKQYYTVGVGGDFNIPRPLSISGVALLLDGLGSPVSVTSITSSAGVATATVTSHGFSSGQSVLIAGATQPAYNGQVTVTVTGASTFTYPLFSPATSPATGTITVTEFATSPVEIPRSLMTDDAYRLVQLKFQTNTLFTSVWYSATEPLGTLFLWPMPTTADNQLVLYVDSQFTAFADYVTEYSWATLPGYEEALEYGLAKRLCAPFGRPENYGDVATMASNALRLVKRSNFRVTDAAVDPGVTSARVGWYNILTGQGGGA